MKSKGTQTKKLAGWFGLFGVVIFATALIIFGNLNFGFNFLEDYVSKLGAKGEPNALGWNLTGFGLVGLSLMGFGITYGKILKDKLAGILLALFGLGFVFTAIPADLADSDSSVSKAHTLAICLALAFWLFGLARISYNKALEKHIQLRANIAAILIVLPVIGLGIGLWSMPFTHRLVFLVVFGWTAISAAELLSTHKK